MRYKNLLRKSASGPALAGTALGVGAVLVTRGLWRWSRPRYSFSGQVVAITGGSRGLGFALAREFASQGAYVAICGRDEGSLREAEQRLRTCGTQILAVRCDVGNQPEAEDFIRQATNRFGRVDVLVNNAGTIEVGPLETQSLADFEDAMQTIFWGAVYTTLAVLPQMQERRSGRIGNVASIGGRVAIPHLLPYSCAKFACIGFSEGLRSELAKDHIAVTTIVPGLMRTGSHVNAIFKGDHRKEYTWFSLAATLPISAMAADRAARKIVRAIARGSAEIVLTPQAKAIAWAHGIAPGTVADTIGIANRFMPGTGSQHQQRFTGRESETAVSRSFLTKLGRTAGRELNQHPERGPDASDAIANSRPLGRRRIGGNRPLPAD